MISLTAEYALRAVGYLAEHRENAHTTQAIADATGIPVGYLAKILHLLARASLVKSRRGLHGGFVLAVTPERISMYDVVLAVDTTMNTRPLTQDRSPLLQRLERTRANIEADWRATSIATVLAQH
jgi:Rrf2 family protein